MPTQGTRRLEINEDLDFQQRDWRIQRVGWGILAAILCAALAGLLGPGPLSKAQVRGGHSLDVEYERFLRHGAQSELLVKVASAGPRAGQVRVAISRDYLSGLDLHQVTPSPLRVLTAGQSIVYVFERVPGPGALHARFVFQPDQLGARAGGIAVDDGSRVSIRQFTYP